MERWLADQEIDALFEGAETAADGHNGIAGVLADVRGELLRPVPETIKTLHLEAMLAVAPAAPVAPLARRRPGRAGPRRALALVACVGATFAYGGLAAANMLPASVNLPHQVHELFGGGRHSHELQSPSTDAAAPGNAQGHTPPPSTGPLRRGDVPLSPSHAPGGGVREHIGKPATTTTVATVTTPTPGHSAVAPGHGATPPGQGGAPPGQTDKPATGSDNDNDNAASPPGQSVTTPAEGATPPGQGGTPPGPAIAPGTNGTTPAGKQPNPGPTAHTPASAPASDATHGKGNANG
ncbi:MAG: hypothetical protein QOI55_2661 [Actinomycetota bacterium]|nr:hypothetical protein [Actinomycetota bacterium]